MLQFYDLYFGIGLAIHLMNNSIDTFYICNPVRNDQNIGSGIGCEMTLLSYQRPQDRNQLFSIDEMIKLFDIADVNA